MKAIRLSRTLIIVIALLVSLGANVTLFVGGVLYGFVDKFVEEAFDLATAAGKQRKALAALKTSSAKQAKAMTALKSRSAKQAKALATSRAVVASQREELDGLNKKNVRLKANNTKLRQDLKSVRRGAASARSRLVKSVGRSVLTAPAKALPYAGIAVVAGVTVLEIEDLCATIQDMNDIRRAAGESNGEAESQLADCSRPDLAVKRAVAQMENFSQTAWDENKKYVPDLQDWENIPDWWHDAWRRTVPDILQDAWERLKRLFP